MTNWRLAGSLALLALLTTATAGARAEGDGKYPDWDGQWFRTGGVQFDPTKPLGRGQQAPLTPEYQAKLEASIADIAAGGHGLNEHTSCLPHGMPRMMNAVYPIEFVVQPKTTYILLEENLPRRIYTDGRGHPEVSDPTFHGHSIGHWEGDTLVVDTVDIVPQAPLAVSEAAGLPNNGDMHVIERIHLTDKDILQDDLEIIAPKILTKPWKTSRIFFRQRARKFDIVEGVCATGDLAERVDANGDNIFVPVQKSEWGHTVAVPAK